MFSAIRRRLLTYYLARHPREYHASEHDGLIYAIEYLAAKESDRYRDPLRLLQYGFKVFSQNDEAASFRRYSGGSALPTGALSSSEQGKARRTTP